MKSLFNESCPDNLKYDETTIDSIFSYCSEEPFKYFYNNYSKIIDNIKESNGLNVRVPITDTEQMLELSKTLPFFYDNIVFSPGPVWPSSHTSLECPWPEFRLQTISLNPVHLGNLSDLRGLLVLKPLIDKGQVIYLPHYGKSLHRWDYPKLNLPSFPDPLEAGPYLEEEITKEKILESVLISLYMDNMVSEKLGCVHLYPSSCVDKISINGTPYWSNTPNQTASYAFLKLKLPYIENLSYEEIAKLKEEENENFKSFSEGIKLALLEIHEKNASDSNLDLQVAKIQRDYIDEPLRELESSLARIAKFHKYRMAGCALTSTCMLFASTLNNEMLNTSSKIIGAVSVFEVFMKFVDYLEKKSELQSNSVFFLLKAKELSKKNNRSDFY